MNFKRGGRCMMWWEPSTAVSHKMLLYTYSDHRQGARIETSRIRPVCEAKRICVARVDYLSYEISRRCSCHPENAGRCAHGQPDRDLRRGPRRQNPIQPD